MNCPLCQVESLVINSRATEDPSAWRRRRQCTGCGYRWTTIEMPEEQAKASRKIVRAVQDLIAGKAEA